MCLWDVASGKVARQWDDLHSPINGVAFAPDGRHIAVANASGTVYVLRVPARQVVAQTTAGP